MTNLAPRTAPLYEITAEYTRVLALLDDPDTDPLALEQELDGLAGKIQLKAGAIVGLIRQFEAYADMRKMESQRMAALAISDARKAERLRDYLLRNMQAVGAERIDTQAFRVTLRQNPPSVQVLEEQLVPEEFLRTVTTTSVDKRAIMDAYKATGEIPDGVDIVRGTRLVIS